MTVNYIHSGAEIQVGGFNPNVRDAQQIATLADGGFVVVYRFHDLDQGGFGIWAQIYEADGAARGALFQMDIAVTDDQLNPQVTALPDGGFVVVWSAGDYYAQSRNIAGRAYEADGAPRGGEFLVDTSPAGTKTHPQIATLSDGGYAVTWEVATDVYARSFNADGTPRTGELPVNTETSEFQGSPRIAALSGGGFVVVWHSNNQDGSSFGVYAQAFGANGLPQGNETLVNTFTGNMEFSPEIAALAGGGYVIAWISAGGQDGNGYGVFAQAFAADGTPIGTEAQVNTYVTDHQGAQSHRITALADGGYVITWTSLGQDLSDNGVYAQAFNADATRRGGEFRVNTYTTSEQSSPDIIALADGGFVISWNSFGQDGSADGVFAQAFGPDGMPRGSEIAVNTYTADGQYAPQLAALNDGGSLPPGFRKDRTAAWPRSMRRSSRRPTHPRLPIRLPTRPRTRMRRGPLPFPKPRSLTSTAIR